MKPRCLFAAVRGTGLLLAVTICAAAAICSRSVAAEETQLPERAAKLYQQAQQTGRFFEKSAQLKPGVHPTSDGRSFLLVWKTVATPKHWIVSLHGAGFPPKGFATDELAVWAPHLKGREVGIVLPQWWLGTGDKTHDFYTPQQIYREVDLLLQELKVPRGAVMLHGFSRGATNTYAVMALDHGKGREYFRLAAADAGPMVADYAPNQALLAGEFGREPLRGTQWFTVAGGRDRNSERDGIAGMKRTSAWLQEQGAVVVETIADPTAGHGALHLNPQNARRVLDHFFKNEK